MKKKGFLIAAISGNLWLKTAAVLIAVVLWAFILFRNQAEINVDIKPVFNNVPEGMIVAQIRPEVISVTIRGNSRLLKQLKSTDIQFRIDLKNAAPGRVFVPANSERLKLPQHLGLVGVTPSGVWVVLEKTAQKGAPPQ